MILPLPENLSTLTLPELLERKRQYKIHANRLRNLGHEGECEFFLHLAFRITSYLSPEPQAS